MLISISALFHANINQLRPDKKNINGTLQTRKDIPDIKPLKDLYFKKLFNNDYDLYEDGSISRTVIIENNQDNIRQLIKIIDNLNYDMAIQIYKTGDERKTYLTIQKNID